MDFAQLIHGFAERNGLGVIEPETDGSYRFVFDDNLPLQCIRASDELIVQSFLGVLPADDQQGLRRSAPPAQAQPRPDRLAAGGPELGSRRAAN